MQARDAQVTWYHFYLFSWLGVVGAGAWCIWPQHEWLVWSATVLFGLGNGPLSAYVYELYNRTAAPSEFGIR